MKYPYDFKFKELSESCALSIKFAHYMVAHGWEVRKNRFGVIMVKKDPRGNKIDLKDPSAYVMAALLAVEEDHDVDIDTVCAWYQKQLSEQVHVQGECVGKETVELLREIK